MLLDRLQNLVVDGDLVSLPCVRSDVSFLLVVEDVALLLGLLCLDPLEVLVVNVLGDLDSRHIHAGGGGQEIPLVHTTKGAAVNLEGSGDEEKAGGQLLQDDNALSLVDSSQDDGQSSRGEGGTELPGLLGEELLGGSSIFVTTNLLLDELRGLVCGLLGNSLGLGKLEDSLLVVGGRLAEPVNSALKGVVPGLTNVLVLCHCSSFKVLYSSSVAWS